MFISRSARLSRWGPIVVAIVLASSPTAAIAEEATAQAQATLIRPLGLSEISNLNFGSVVLGESVGQVSLSPGGELTALGATIGDKSQANSASFAIIGQNSQAFTISLPAKVRFANGKDVVWVETFTHNAGATPALGKNGSGQFNIGATLRLGHGNPNGIYDGNMAVTISNN